MSVIFNLNFQFLFEYQKVTSVFGFYQYRIIFLSEQEVAQSVQYYPKYFDLVE